MKREHYQSDTPAQAVADIASDHAKVFTKLDAMKGYHQCPLAQASQDLTTFLTPFGQFKFVRAPGRMSYPPYPSITTGGWTRHFLASLDTGASSMT